MNQVCPVCANDIISPVGSSECEYLIIEEFPELTLPTPGMSTVSKWKKDEWTPKKIMDNELQKVGMSIRQFRIVSVYMHDDGSVTPNGQCYDFGLEYAVSECYGRKGVIILGHNLCKAFTGYELKQVQGLSEVKSLYISDRIRGGFDAPRVFLPTIRSIYSVGAGEFGLGLQRFANQLGE